MLQVLSPEQLGAGRTSQDTLLKRYLGDTHSTSQPSTTKQQHLQQTLQPSALTSYTQVRAQAPPNGFQVPLLFLVLLLLLLTCPRQRWMRLTLSSLLLAGFLLFNIGLSVV